ncbi:hypothetical protein HPB49_008655 [Dermacentor silvarum]|uniref:Uncharacterized protein n=1 Tax=Dermacentor silvarum TaxID=543639 RepID=A0ACB8CE85_DERSI|nr:hypothetical protein HPB49_008655 [Dermacentor silvarum]
MGSTAGFKLAATSGQPRSPWFTIASTLVVVLSLASTDAWPALDSTTLDSNGSDAADAAVVRGATGLAVVCACGADVAKCPAGRTAKTPSRCPPCGLVCARQTGEACSVDEPCAKDFGLSCDPVSFTCKADDAEPLDCLARLRSGRRGLVGLSPPRGSRVVIPRERDGRCCSSVVAVHLAWVRFLRRVYKQELGD